jgi:hypothetical protein
VNGVLNPILLEIRESFTQRQNVVTTQITNVAPIEQQTKIVATCIKQEMKMLHTEVLQSIASSSKAEKPAKSLSERIGKDV